MFEPSGGKDYFCVSDLQSGFAIEIENISFREIAESIIGEENTMSGIAVRRRPAAVRGLNFKYSSRIKDPSDIFNDECKSFKMFQHMAAIYLLEGALLKRKAARIEIRDDIYSGKMD